MKYIKFLNEVGKEDVPLVGGKAANLGEMIKNTGVPVPPGFAITSKGYWRFIEHNKLKEKIQDALNELTDPNDTEKLSEIGSRIRWMITTGEFPEDLENEIKEAYKKLVEKIGEEPFVAVRSSATAEDLPDASFAGQQETYLNIKGIEQVLEKVKECFASLFTDRAIFYRIQKGFDHMKVALSVVVQQMVRSKAAGVMFTLDVRNGRDDIITIEGSWGLGEYIVQGVVTPDEFFVNKNTLEIVEQYIAKKEKMLVRKEDGGTEEQEVPEELQEIPVLTEEQVKELAKYGIELEKHYNHPQDIEWALDESGKLFIVQTRAETVWSSKKRKQVSTEIIDKKIIAKGHPASPGIGSGKVKIVRTYDDLDKVQKGDVLVTKMTDPDMVPAMKKASAIVTQEGGITSHAAIVSRELGIPCVVGVENIFEVVKDGMEITVNGSTGEIYEGIIETEKEDVSKKIEYTSVPITGTKILVNLGIPEKAEEIAKLPVDGVGLMREEFILATYVKKHPLKMIKEGKAEEFVEILSQGIERVVRAFYPRPVVLRFSDFKSNEYRELEGGEEFEPHENNPMIGWRGCSRYISPEFEEAFRLEVRAVKKVREKGLKNLWVMIPFVRTIEEMKAVLNIMEEEGLKRDRDLKVWIMAEVPSVALLIDEFSDYCDGFSIGSNDLTQLTLGIDRDSERLADEFDERNPAVLRAIEMIIEGAKRNGKTVSICGQAPSVYPEFVEFLVKKGIDSISVNPDKVIETRKLVAQVEKKLMLEFLRETH